METTPTLTAAQLRALDAYAIETLGLPSIVLMENAGRNAAHELLCALRVQTLSERRPAPPWRIAVLCGRGGNGGDGYVVARHLANAGATVTVLSAVDPSSLRDDAALERAVCERMGVRVVDAGDSSEWAVETGRLD